MLKSLKKRTIKLAATSVIHIDYDSSEISKKDVMRFVKQSVRDTFPIKGGKFDFKYKAQSPKFYETT